MGAGSTEVGSAVNMNHNRSDARVRGLALAALAVFLIFMALVFWFVGRPLVRFVSEPEQFRLWVDENGLWGRLAFVGMMAVQIIIAIIPGEPLEIGAGYAFGAVEGTVLCILGAMLGSLIIFLLVRRFGVKLLEVFFPLEKIQSMRFMKDTRRLSLLAFIIVFIPGTPKDLIAYFVGLTRMRLHTWMLITATARIPSVITSTIGGDALGTQNYLLAGIIFAVTLLISLAGIIIYRKISRGDGGLSHE